MPTLRLHPALINSTRLVHFTSTSENMTLVEWVMLLLTGVSAALMSTLLDFHLRMPGHAILKVVFPVAVGLSLVPRKGAGTIIGVSAILTAMSLRSAGFGGSGLGFGALTSLAAIGPFLDWSLRRANSGKGIYIGFIIAGLATNVLAFAVRGTMKVMGWESAGRSLGAWLSQAVVTYAICGVIAGLLSAAILFHARPRRQQLRLQPNHPKDSP